MKKQKIYTIILATAIFTTSILTPVFASTTTNSKEEIVYALLNDDGSTKNLYVVNNIDVNNSAVLDYGNYSNIRNLNTEDTLTIKDNEITTTTQSNKLYYEGVLSTLDLPWNINIIYTLNGEAISSKDLPGKDGDLEISISITENKNSNDVFFQNYALQISTSLDTNKCSNITATGATIATVGENKSISYTNLPNKESTYKISTTVKDFEMAPISINAIPFSMDVDLSGLDDISENLAPLQNGISEVNLGAKSLEEASLELYTAINTLNKSSDTLANSSNELYSAIKTINNSLKAIEDIISPDGAIASLTSASEKYLAGINDLASKSSLLVAASSEISNGINSSNEALTAITTDSEETKQLIAGLSSMNNENINKLIALYTGKMSAVSNVNTGLSTLSSKYDEFNNGLIALSEGATNLSKTYTELNTAISTLSNKLMELDTLITGMNNLSTQYSSFNNGVINYTDGFKKITNGYNNLVSGITSISNATNEIDSKTSTLDKDIENQLDTALSNFKNDDFKPVSFVSDKNTNVTAVQFVMKTDEIKKEVPEPIVEEKAPNLSFIEKLKSLFK